MVFRTRVRRWVLLQPCEEEILNDEGGGGNAQGIGKKGGDGGRKGSKMAR